MPELSIKQKIILGFSAIGALLIAASGFFFVSLQSISSANHNIGTIAVPVQQQSKELQLAALSQAKAAAQGYQQSQLGQVNQLAAELTSINQDFMARLASLSKNLQDRPAMLTLLQETEQQQQAFLAVGKTLFDAKRSYLASSERIAEQMQEFKTVRFDASGAMIDLDLIEADESQQELREAVIGSGTRIDDMLFTLENSTLGIAAISDPEEVTKHREDTGFLLNNIATNLGYLKQQSAPFGEVKTIAVFDEKFARLRQMLEQPGELYLTQSARLEQVSSMNEAYTEVESRFHALSTTLESLNQLALTRFQELEQDAQESISGAKTLSMLIAVIFALLAFVIAYFTIKAMLGPLGKVNRALDAIAGGDLSQRTSHYNHDEFGQLLDNINTLAEKLGELMADVSRNAELLDNTASLSEQQGQQIMESTRTQLQQVSDAAGLAGEIVSGASSIQTQTADTSVQIAQASQFGGTVNGIARDNRERIEQLAERLGEAVSTMQQLVSQGNEIGGIVDTIGAIAEQTNLLALNAAIEAARAGEEGRGFAVVADEVRSLAGRTQDATGNIQSMIAALQNQARETEQIIIAGRQEVARCNDQSAELTSAVVEIEQSLGNINLMSQQIASAATQQAAVSQSIREVMSRLEQHTRQSTEEASQMASQSTDMTQLAHCLSASVARFKV